jgi:S-adenosylmethionine hydrolase
LPSGTVILGVVDPGVGTDRRAIAFRTSEFICVGPDNGLFSYLLDPQAIETAVEISNPDYSSGMSSRTFHGRDIFAPAAAHLATGVPLSALGSNLDKLVELAQPVLEIVSQELIRGEVLYADHFGNLVTSIGKLSTQGSHLHLSPWIGSFAPIEFSSQYPLVSLPDGTTITLAGSFGDVPLDALTAYIGSAGLLEIAVNQGSASERTGLTRGHPIKLRLQG